MDEYGNDGTPSPACAVEEECVDCTRIFPVTEANAVVRGPSTERDGQTADDEAGDEGDFDDGEDKFG